MSSSASSFFRISVGRQAAKESKPLSVKSVQRDGCRWRHFVAANDIQIFDLGKRLTTVGVLPGPFFQRNFQTKYDVLLFTRPSNKLSTQKESGLGRALPECCLRFRRTCCPSPWEPGPGPRSSCRSTSDSSITVTGSLITQLSSCLNLLAFRQC